MDRVTRRALGIGCLVAVVACGDPPREEDGVPGPTQGGASDADSNTSGDSATATSGASATATASGTGPTSGAADSTGGVKFDMGGVDIGVGNGEGCQKIDFLFVIDNSHSMREEQDALIASFDGFVQTMQETLTDATDYHVMVVDSDAFVFEGCFDCAIKGECAPNYDYECDGPLECEDVLGAGVVFPRGAEASQTNCAFSSGARYMTSDEADLAGKFACAARVGIGSTIDPEKPMEALVAAIGPAGDAAACNEGFLRDDAILVVTFITDEDDDDGDGSNGGAVAWHDAIVTAKNGDETAAVVLGLFGDEGCAEPSPRLDDFVGTFGDHGFTGSVCAASYDSFFAEAVGIIETTCENFEPVG